MHTLTYLVLALIAATVVIRGSNRAVDRMMKDRRPGSEAPLYLVEEFDVRPDPGPRRGRRRLGQRFASGTHPR